MRAIKNWLSNSDQAFLLAGYAGTGKTTLVQEFVNGLDSEPLCLAPTGKAASVLQKRLKNARVSTIHRALYCPHSPDNEKLMQLEAAMINHPTVPELRQAYEAERARLAGEKVRFSLRTEIQPGQLVIVDESSMVTSRMFRDLLQTGAKLLFVGDPGQLPPVQDKGFFDAHNPDVMLEQIQRQALDSPIMRLSMQVRRDLPLEFDGQVCRRENKASVDHDEWLTYDQVLTGKNETRRKVNKFFRRKLGKDGIWPVAGERLICLKNEKDGSTYFVNGVMCSAVSDADLLREENMLAMDLLYEGEFCGASPVYTYPFEAHYSNNATEDPWQFRQGLRELDYAYAITVHKAQGSEWNSVILADDGINAGQRTFRQRWLYTAVTRAKEKLLWILN